MESSAAAVEEEAVSAEQTAVQSGQEHILREDGPSLTAGPPTITPTAHEKLMTFMTPEQPAERDYSAFTVSQIRCIIFFSAFVGWLSPLSGSIYYPALETVGEPTI